jgi:putative transposase
MSSRKKSSPRGRPKLGIKLKKEDRRILRRMLSRGELPVRVFKRARTLQLYDEGKSSPECAEALGIGEETARRTAKKYLEGGLDLALYEASRPGAERVLDEKQEARIIAMICSKAPEGSSRWSLSLIVKEAIGRGYVESISEETIRRLLHRRELKPWREKNVVRGKA